MRIGSALLTAAMIISGIVVIEANPASAQAYYGPAYRPANPDRTPDYGNQGPGSGGGYAQRGYDRPADVAVVYEEEPGYHPVARYGYADPRVETPVYAAPVYQTPVYEAPRYAPPAYARPVPVRETYVTPVYTTPVDPCRDR